MRRLAMPFILLLSAVIPLSAQDMTGMYVYRPPEGIVTLELQHSGDRVTGIMTGLDGSRNPLEGTFENGRASGGIRMNSGTGWFAVGVSGAGDGVTLLVAVLDPATGEPDMTKAWQLEFARADAAAAGGIAPASAGAPAAAGSAGASDPGTATPLAREWTGHLAGRKVTYIDSYGSGGSGFSDRWEAYLCTDGGFHFRSSSSMSADVGGVFGNSNSSGSFSGSWRVIEQNGQALLQYQRAEQAGTGEGQWIALGYQDGTTYFDGARVYVTDDNTVCR